jgi:hypothetical protein
MPFAREWGLITRQKLRAGADKNREDVFTNELGPLHGDHGKRGAPLRVKEDVAHGRRDYEGGWGLAELRRIHLRNAECKRTEPNEGCRFRKTLATYGASDDEADILDTGPESAARPP